MDKEEQVAIIKSLLSDVETSGMNEFYESSILEGLKNYKDYKAIDQALVATLKDQFQNGVKPKRELDNVMRTIENGSVVVYFKSAQMFKIYQKDDIEKVLGGELRTLYKNLGSTYEVVPTDKEQKIIIIGDGSLVNSLDKIKRYIIAFMKEKGVNTMSEKDLICYKNEGYVEIIVNNYYVSNSVERKAIVNELLEYIRQKEQSESLANSMGRSYYSAIAGADMVKMPPGKESIGGFIEPSSGLITNLAKCQKIERVAGGNTYNTINISIAKVETLQMATNISNGSTNTVNNTLIINTVTEMHKLNIEAFLDFIRDTQPEWFKEGEWVEKKYIEDKYLEMYDEYGFPKNFWPLTKDRLYVEESRPRTSKLKNGKKVRPRTVLLQLYSKM